MQQCSKLVDLVISMVSLRNFSLKSLYDYLCLCCVLFRHSKVLQRWQSCLGNRENDEMMKRENERECLAFFFTLRVAESHINSLQTNPVEPMASSCLLYSIVLVWYLWLKKITERIEELETEDLMHLMFSVVTRRRERQNVVTAKLKNDISLCIMILTNVSRCALWERLSLRRLPYTIPCLNLKSD